MRHQSRRICIDGSLPKQPECRKENCGRDDVQHIYLQGLEISQLDLTESGDLPHSLQPNNHVHAKLDSTGLRPRQVNVL